MKGNNIISFDEARKKIMDEKKHSNRQDCSASCTKDWFKTAADSFEKETGIKTSEEEMLGVCAIICELQSM
ncbi:hypothetical protein IKF28_01320 [Candidatus Saccharibacteria bacterium]|nr:hypothetical protein [Candidatus Saccharibacteria bacterium]